MNNTGTVAQQAPNAYNNMMNINYLRSIGRSLLKVIRAKRYAPGRENPIGFGAAGALQLPREALELLSCGKEHV